MAQDGPRPIRRRSSATAAGGGGGGDSDINDGAQLENTITLVGTKTHVTRKGTGLSDEPVSPKSSRYSALNDTDAVLPEKATTASDEGEISGVDAEKQPVQAPVVANMEDMALKALHVDDDPTLNPWTLRMWFLGIGLSAFGASLATIFLFKPQSVSVSVIFLTVISYVLGNGLAAVLPSAGRLGPWLNPHPFNSKEHLAVIIMSSSASGAAYATEVLATQKLYYGVVPSAAVAVLLLFSSQLLGYGMAGVLRASLVYPTQMLWPSILPLSALVETLHRDRAEMRKRFRFFWLVFGLVAVWELLPQYVMPVLVGVSVFCLAGRDSLAFTNVFGGTSGNEGLGLLSLSFDWQYITTSNFFLPLITQANGFVGYVLGAGLFAAAYYANLWDARRFPFLSQELFSPNSTGQAFAVYNQSAILDARLELDTHALEREGLPSFATTNALYLITTNLGIASTIVHMCLWNRDVVKTALNLRWVDLSTISRYARSPKLLLARMKAGRSRPSPSSSSSSSAAAAAAALSAASVPEEERATLDPHHAMMLAYKEVPSWWYVIVLVVSTVVAVVCTYALNSTLPFWGFLIAVVLSFLGTLFFGAMGGLIGFQVPITSVIQLIGGYLHPGKPVANMYFVLFGANAQSQALSLVASLKLGQYGKLSPRCTFTVQIVGTLLGAVLNYVLMSSITTNQRDVLLSIQGTNIWSGQVIQSFNSNAIAFGALSKYMFSVGRTYQWVVLALPVGLALPVPFWLLHRRFPKAGLDYLVTPVVAWYLGYLSVGINSSVTVSFVLGFLLQSYVRRRHPEWFLKYNYLLAAAISGGTELLVFVTTFAVQGASGKAVPFPPYWGNNFQKGNYDYCKMNPALGG